MSSERVEAEGIRVMVSAEETVVAKRRAETSVMRDEAAKDLNEVSSCAEHSSYNHVQESWAIFTVWHNLLCCKRFDT